MPKPKEKKACGKPKLLERAALAPKEIGRLLKKQYAAQQTRSQPEDERETRYVTDWVEGTVEGTASYTADAAGRGLRHIRREKKERARRRAAAEADAQAAAGPEGQSGPGPSATGQVPREQIQDVTGHPDSAEFRPTSPRPVERRHTVALSAEVYSREHLRMSGHQDPRQMAKLELAKERAYHRGGSGPVSAPPGYPDTPMADLPRPKTAPGAPRGRVPQSSPMVPARPKTGPQPHIATPSHKAPMPPKAPGQKQAGLPRTNPAAASLRQKAKQQAAKRASRPTAAQAQRAAKTTANVAVKVGKAVVRAVTAMAGSLMGLLGGGVLVVILSAVAVIGALVASPFGILFSGEAANPDSVSLAVAVGTVNTAFSDYLNELQSARDYDSIQLHGSTTDWPEVLAVFAVKTALYDGENAADVAELDADRVERLEAVFGDINPVRPQVEEVYHEDSDPLDGVDDSWTEYILHLYIENKTADAMIAAYGFDAQEQEALAELLGERELLGELSTNLAVSDYTPQEVLENLPEGLAPERRAVVEAALRLVGKVPYFWGGKSSAIGWDSRWGTLQKVTSSESSSTGMYLPYGLDCTGFLNWAFRNAGLPSDGHWYIGANLTELDWADSLPGDIALFPDASHVGLVIGRSADGGILVCHCSYSQNNVVITDCAATGFTAIGRPDVLARKDCRKQSPNRTAL